MDRFDFERAVLREVVCDLCEHGLDAWGCVSSRTSGYVSKPGGIAVSFALGVVGDALMVVASSALRDDVEFVVDLCDGGSLGKVVDWLVSFAESCGG